MIFDRNEIPANDNWTVLKERVVFFMRKLHSSVLYLFKKMVLYNAPRNFGFDFYDSTSYDL